MTATVPLTTVVSNPRENIYLRPNDVLTLVRDPQTFIAVGALGNSTELPFQADGITLAQALAKARGLSDFAADPAGTFIFRFEPASVVRRLSPGSKLLGTPLVRWSTGSTCATPTACSCPRRSGCATAT